MRAQLREIARHTEGIVHTGHYRSPLGREVTFAAELAIALAGTRIYGPDPVPVSHLDNDRPTRIEVTGEGSIQAAHRLSVKPDPVAVLNFASARNPGGGYLNGAQA
ncbi:TIGR02452 family protein [Actinokineospora alba]|uniref:TIGR02452 family protein n=1 Tax=Actinokineospora alba TaxID=504798 RepID=A0A1H0TV68_9PSEU|nr:TIGR02452 family protein [Actinokineospora alba]SDP57947.1 TIGR02452 family protein [Actinokineospora alba]